MKHRSRTEPEKVILETVLSEADRKLASPLEEDMHKESLFGFQPIPSDGVVVTNELIDALRDEDVY